MEFRIWDSKIKLMMHAPLIYLMDIEGVTLRKNKHQTEEVQMLDVIRDAVEDTVRFTIMQSTGARHEGTLVYEGDVLWDAHKEISYQIKYEKTEGAFIATGIHDNVYERLENVLNDNDIGIVGNIYEQAALLEERERKHV
jgi:uncharacterized phage protein (TIGR01671 family)